MNKKIYKFVLLLLAALPFSADIEAQALPLEWATKMGGNQNDSGEGIAVDKDGNVYTTGAFRGTADFDPGAGAENLIAAGGDNEYTDIFVSKLDADGNFEWARRMGGTNHDRGEAVAVDNDGNVYVTGYFRGRADFGTTELVSAGTSECCPGGRDIFVCKLDKDGNFNWAKRMGGERDDDSGYGITVGSDGYVYVTGEYRGQADFGSIQMTSQGTIDAFITKLNPENGNFVWVKSIGGTNIASCNAMPRTAMAICMLPEISGEVQTSTLSR